MFQVLQGLRAAAEPTRLRILALCARGELTVSDLTAILGQSQPRVSRHLKVLVEAGLLQRLREGTWAFYRLSDTGAAAGLAHGLVGFIPDGNDVVARDLERLELVKQLRADVASSFFRRNAGEWDGIRKLYINDEEVERALLALLPRRDVHGLLDIGTGTGRMLEIFGNNIDRGVGIDLSREMLAVARVNLDKLGLRNCHVRYGDMNQLPFTYETFDAVTFHLVLHYAENPGAAVKEAARFLEPGGRLVVVDFAPHEEEKLRTEHGHRWLGFEDGEVKSWFKAAGLSAGRTTRLPGDPLTVCLWSATRDGARTRPGVPAAEIEART
jgi:SAM-dependent methyltransferase/DNA-binding transcriptional ArsR family regulator